MPLELPGKPFSITKGDVVMDALPQTVELVSAESNYLASHLGEIRAVLESSGPASMLHMAHDFTLACRMDDVELGHVAEGSGRLCDPGAIKFSVLLDSLEN